MSTVKKPYDRPTMKAISAGELLESMGPAHAGVYVFAPLPDHSPTGVGGGGGGAMQGS